MNNIEKYIPVALDVLEDEHLKIVRNGEIDSTYNGYISSFGASLISSGLLPTMIFYSKRAKESGNGEEGDNKQDADRGLIVKALEMMLKNTQIGALENDQRLLQEVITRHNEPRLKQKIQECAIALKLAIRTYPHPKN